MTKNLHFADATASFDDARFVLFGVPYDRTTSFRSGARFGPNAIREASYNFETYLPALNLDLAAVPVCDEGNLEEAGAAGEMVRGVQQAAERIVAAGKFPIALGGEHSLASGAVRAFRDVAVISVDAHLDFRDAYLGEKWSHACSSRRISEHVGVGHIVPFGVRSYSKEEAEDAARLKLHHVTAFDALQGDFDALVQDVLRRFGNKPIYLTIDMDGIDPAYAPAVGNPEPYGLTPFHVRRLIHAIAPRLIGLDVNEVSPPWDGGETALVAAGLVREAMAVVAKARG